MYKGNKILGIIPARGGSKRIPRKNIKQLSGKPLVAWTIEQAKSSKYIDNIIVSTEDEEIAEISKKYGAEVPFLRPKELAADEAKVSDVVLHAINWFERNNEFYDLLVRLQLTSPLRKIGDIDEAIELLFSKSAEAIISVCEVEHHPYWAGVLPEDGCMRDFLKPGTVGKSRQELPVCYRLNGSISLAYVNYLKNNRSFWGKNTYAYVMPRERSLDIDYEIDFIVAETLMKNSKKH
ncbi:CMP-N,N'-diacetyllegionaminic acid synthase [bacterium BMS3Abin10]|nr:CMP-N,N'-diacetyllegionaminic acid synthase [bacterium BMS3Abin10]GBE39921.1 CMP-N,N'-diacetyllegionaminic acid synthase [bacterium BMS3Bbin08]HDZ60907.1 acylneuraminate cytidylyltransferase family protein [Candidatus Pacearchaeota archaeon]